MPIPSTFESLLLAEVNLGLPPTSFFKLMAEPDDWSFTLKLNAILESALNCLLQKRLLADDFDDMLRFYRKVELVFELPECSRDSELQEFLVALNSLRNRFAHRAKYIFANFSTVFEDMPRPKRRSLMLRLAVTITTRNPNPRQFELEALRERWMSSFPRVAIFNSASHALELLSLAYYVQIGKDGNCYAEDFGPELQDLLSDPAVIEFQRGFNNWLRDAGPPEE